MKTNTSMFAPFLHLKPKSPQAIKAFADRALEEAQKELDLLLSVSKHDSRTVENTLEPLNRIAIILGGAGSQTNLFAAVHPDASIRTAAEKAQERIGKFSAALYVNRAVYEAVQAVPAKGLDPVTNRFREKELREFKFMGVDKSLAVRREVKMLVARIMKLGQTFDRNIKNDVRYVDISVEDLDGLPEDYRTSHAPNAKGIVKISTQYPDYMPFMQYATSVTARKKLYFAYNNRAWPKNDAVFKNILSARERLAHLIGYRDFADFISVDKMTGSGKAIRKFLDRVATLTKPQGRKEYAMFLARKQKDVSTAKTFEPWEFGYYDNILTKELVGLDTQEVRSYFSFPHVRDGVLGVAGKLFGLSYKKANVQVWHKDVEAYDVWRAGKCIGRFYLDLHPREGKYGHAACFDVRSGIKNVQLPEVALICNFSRTLMTHNEVSTFLHEFGHLVHFILAGEQRWARFSGFSTEWDFVEAPSQMLESWALDLKTLRTFARHHKTGTPIPAPLVLKMQKADSFARAMVQCRQTFLSGISLAYHQSKNPGKTDLLSVFRREEKKYGLIRYPQGVHMYASFGHLNNYTALYYTYTWSRAIAEEILMPFKKKGMYDKQTAQRYAETVLMPGGSKDARQLLKDFLGREWNLKAFEKWLKE